MIRQAVPVIGGADRHRVLQVLGGPLRFHDLADLLVDERDVAAVIRTLTVSFLLRRMPLMHNRIVVNFAVVLDHPAVRLRLVVEFLLVDRQQRQVFPHVRIGVADLRIVGRMRTRKANLQKQWLGLGIALEPPSGEATDKRVRVHVLIDRPLQGTESSLIVGQAPVGQATRLTQASGAYSLVSFVKKMGLILRQGKPQNNVPGQVDARQRHLPDAAHLSLNT